MFSSYCWSSNLQPFYKEKPLILNREYHQTNIDIFLKVADVRIFASDVFNNNIKKFLTPGQNPTPDIILQIKTITDQYTILSNTLDDRQKYTNPETQKQEKNCKTLMEIFRDATASYLVNEIEILSKDLYPVSQDISDISKCNLVFIIYLYF